jgi:hypothetical protein
MSSQSDLRLIMNIITKLDANRAARFAYTQAAYDMDAIDGVDLFDINAQNNIPKAIHTDYSDTVLDKGLQAQGASITRSGWNHFIGRLSMNLNKHVQKFKELLDITAATWAHNALEYDKSAHYAFNDVCYYIETIENVIVYTFYQRISQSPQTISGVSPTVQLHWAPMQNKTSTSALLPFKAPGYQHKYVVVDLTHGYVANTWYPVITTLQDFEAKVLDHKEGVLQVLLEAYCNGPVSGYTGNYKAELVVLSKFTGFQNSSTDIVLDNSFIRQDDGSVITVANSPIGFSTLSKGRQAIMWLKGGSKYALWNSFGSTFNLAADSYDNQLDAVVTPVNYRPFVVNSGTIQARIKTPNAEESNDAVNLSQVSGSLALPKQLSQGEQLDSVRIPGLYVAISPAVGNTIGNVPISNPGIFELVVEGDRAGQVMTTQRLTHRATGDVWVRVMAGNGIMVPWYKASSPDGVYVETQGLYAFQINSAGHLILHYQTGTDVPAFHINGNGHLIADL